MDSSLKDVKRLIKKKSGDKMDELFRNFITNSTELMIWELNSQGKRKLFNGKLTRFELEDNIIEYELENQRDLLKRPLIYIYSQEKKCIYKANFISCLNGKLKTQYPYEIRILDSFQKKGNISLSKKDSDMLEQHMAMSRLDEEDLEFGEVRETPRTRPGIDKTIKISYEAIYGITESVHILHDLSQGGVGIIVTDISNLRIGQEINILKLDQNVFDTPLPGIVRSIREVNDLGIEFKVGIQFK